MSSQTAEAARRSTASPPPKRRFGTRGRVVVGVAGVAILALVMLLLRGGTDKSKVATTKGATTTVAGEVNGVQPQTAGSGAPGGGSSGAGSQGAGTDNLPVATPDSGPASTPGIPLNVTVSNTKGLKDGDVVKIHVVPKDGSIVYGFEAFLCKGGVPYTLDAHVRPTFAGNCVPPSRPLSAVSQSYEAVKVAPPYKSADGEFRVGVGTTTYPVQRGGTTTVMCDHDHFCALVLKLQYPNAFGFETIPITYQ